MNSNRFRQYAALALMIAALSITFGNSPVNGSSYPAVTSSSSASFEKLKADKPDVDIDSTIAPLTGKRVMYCLTDEEGGLILESTGQGRKVPAIVTYNYRGDRNADGVLISPLIIFRPAFAGGILQKDDVPSSSDRTPGSWDNFQPGDLRN
jgi:hypothetical protein